MEKLTKDISDIILSTANNINEKVKGLNFLEILKDNLFEKLLQTIDSKTFPLDQTINFEQEIKENSRIFSISINYFTNSLTITKRKIENDTLMIVINESSNLDIFKDKKNFKSILLFKNTGISLPKDTIINSKFNKNLLLLQIINKDIQ